MFAVGRRTISLYSGSRPLRIVYCDNLDRICIWYLFRFTGMRMKRKSSKKSRNNGGLGPDQAVKLTFALLAVGGSTRFSAKATSADSPCPLRDCWQPIRKSDGIPPKGPFGRLLEP